MKPPYLFRRTEGLLLGILLASFAITLIALILGPTFKPKNVWKGGAYSYSAVGQHAFVSLVTAMGHPVQQSRFLSSKRAGENSVLLVVAPTFEDAEEKQAFGELTIKQLKEREGRTIIVLPKYEAVGREKDNSNWVKRLDFVEREQAAVGLEVIEGDTQLSRLDTVDNCVWSNGEPALLQLTTPQTLNGKSLTPIISCGAELIAAVGQTRAGADVLVVSDPDLLNNWSIGRGENGPVAYELFKRFVGDMPIVFDETTHGHLVPPSLWRMMFDGSMVFLSLQALLLIMFALWKAAVRFQPVDEHEWHTGRGVGELIDNTASLLSFGLYSQNALQRYLDLCISECARALRAPRELSRFELVHWLDGVRGENKSRSSLAELVEACEALDTNQRVRAPKGRLKLAQRIYSWKEETLDHAR